MNLSMPGKLATDYTSGSQRAGKVTEAWGADNFYCPNCSSPKLDWLKPNTKANDYCCPKCGFWYQLKSQKTRIGNSITDGAYGAMMEAIRNDRTPNFFFLHYDLASWRVKSLLLVPSFAFPESAIIKRKPLAVTARRAGWIGCNIALGRIPLEARIVVVADNRAVSEREVRAQYKRVKPLEQIPVKERGWTLDVLNIVRRMVEERRSAIKPAREDARPTNEFANENVYEFVRELERLHPGNRHIKDKIRQQLQKLRDHHLLVHAGRNCWRLP
jgi:type II restriction enzyme